MPGLTFFPNLSKFITFAAAPLVLTPFVRNQGKSATRAAKGLAHGVARQVVKRATGWRTAADLRVFFKSDE